MCFLCFDTNEQPGLKSTCKLFPTNVIVMKLESKLFHAVGAAQRKLRLRSVFIFCGSSCDHGLQVCTFKN